MNESPHERFANVRLPRWYRVTARIVRVIGFLIFLTCAWKMTQQDGKASGGMVGGIILGILLLILPSLPKAYLEQRNRNRGLRDGSFQEFLESQKKKDR
jgi:hypothetical protein